MQELLFNDVPKRPGKMVIFMHFVDANLMHDLVPARPFLTSTLEI